MIQMRVPPQKIQSIADDLSSLTDNELRMLAFYLGPTPLSRISNQFLEAIKTIMELRRNSANN